MFNDSVSFAELTPNTTVIGYVMKDMQGYANCHSEARQPAFSSTTLNLVSAEESAVSNNAALNQRFMASQSRFFTSRTPVSRGGLIQWHWRARVQNDMEAYAMHTLLTCNYSTNPSIPQPAHRYPRANSSR